MDKAQRSIKFVDGHYRIAIPWKEERVSLLNKYCVDCKIWKSVWRRSQKFHKHTKNIEKYFEKGYIRQVDSLEKPKATWYLPHFTVVRTDRLSTKTRIVFDASAKHCGISLNDAIHQGPKLQQELFKVLICFRRYPVALVCDIAEMYLQIELYPQDRMFHRFYGEV